MSNLLSKFQNEIEARKYHASIKDFNCKKVMSLSGGGSSSYMALHYEADYHVFALVLANDKHTIPQDKGLLREILKRCPSFNGTRELPETLKIILQLEQELQKPIKWVHGKPLDEIIKSRKMLPNNRARFCTQEAKIKPIFEYVYTNILQYPGDFVEMPIGLRFDEPARVYRMMGARLIDSEYDWQSLGSCEDYKSSLKCDISTKKHRWENVHWRVRTAPLWADIIEKSKINKFWDSKNWDFPKISNCDGCFHHTNSELKEHFELYPERMQWWINQENMIGNTFKNNDNYQSIKISKCTKNSTKNHDCDCSD